MTDSEEARLLRQALGRQLAAWRYAAGYTQAQLARETGYARSTVSTVESGRQHVARAFWECCDRTLRTGGALVAAFGRMEEQKAAEHTRQARQAGSVAAADSAVTGPVTLAAYRRLGWPAEEHDGRLELVTGGALEALELARPAGMLAVHWWLGSDGVADEIRGLPALPRPATALAVLTAGNSFYFLVQAGAFPWTPGAASARPDGTDLAAAIRWHSEGSRIPAPPSPAGDGSRAAWLHIPAGEVRLPDPITLLDLFAKAAAAVRHRPDALALPGGILAVPARADSP